METKKQILLALDFRYACKEFDVTKKILRDDFEVILESAHLSPSSFGFEPWKLLIVDNQDIRKKLKPFCWGAQAQLDTSNHFVIILARKGKDMKYSSEYIKHTMADIHKSSADVIVKRIERLKQFQEEDFELNDGTSLFHWACRQTYIVLANMMMTASLLSIDSCPIESFNKRKVEEVLFDKNLFDKEHFEVSCMIAFGYRISPPNRQRTRRSVAEIIKWIE